MMKYLLSLPIMLYQAFFPKKYRGECLFKESCSNYVLRITNEDGLINGINALRFRYENCRTGYYLSKKGNEIILISSANQVFVESEIDQRILDKERKNIIS